jgi:hypothetical protein
MCHSNRNPCTMHHAQVILQLGQLIHNVTSSKRLQYCVLRREKNDYLLKDWTYKRTNTFLNFILIIWIQQVCMEDAQAWPPVFSTTYPAHQKYISTTIICIGFIYTCDFLRREITKLEPGCCWASPCSPTQSSSHLCVILQRDRQSPVREGKCECAVICIQEN